MRQNRMESNLKIGIQYVHYFRKSQLDLLGETENVFSKGPLTPE